LKFKLI